MNNDSFTLFCSEIDKITNQKKYKRIYFNNIDWQSNAGVKYLKYNKSSMNTDSDILLFVPYRDDLKYVSPKKYSQLLNKDSYYTFNTHDKIVKGIVDININNAIDMKNLEMNYDDVVDILKVTNCDMF
ncbi:MAG: hypothetical protein ACRDD7_08780, partial [Peptostreptococcaceae bacterium]